MGSRKTYFSQSLKRIAALASVLGAIGGITVATASAQTAQFESLNQAFQQQAPGQGYAQQMPPQENVARLASTSYAPTQFQNSARIIRSQPAFLPARRQATGNRRVLIGRGRMHSAGFRQEPGVLGSLPQKPGRTVLQKKDDTQDFFGDNQAVPTIPRNDTPTVPRPDTPQPDRLQDGELPPNVFRNPFDKERRPKPDGSTIDVPGDLTPEVPNTPKDPPKNDDEPSENTDQQQNPNPFEPQENKNDKNEIDYQPGRGLNTTRSQSNVYRPPGPEDALDPNYKKDNGVYFVPAYDPIPGTQQSTLAPPARISPNFHAGQQPPWPGQQYAPQQPPYQQPPWLGQQYAPQQPAAPHAHPQQFSQQQQYAHPQQYGQQQYAQPQYGQPQQYAPTPARPPQQQVYSSVVEPSMNMACGSKGPMTPVRRGLFGKIQQDLKKDWGFGDYQSCQNSGNCGGCSNGGCSNGGCSSGCDTSCDPSGVAKCPVFYIGFQGAWNEAFNVTNGQGSELELDDGSAFYFSLGRMNGRNLRTEIELSFRNNDISSLLTPTAELPYTGQLQSFSGMANLYWEFVNFPTGRLKPYIGGGVGFMSLSSDLSLMSDPSPTNIQTESSSSFAYQWMAGVNFKVSNHLDLYGEYRFVDADSFGIGSDRDDLSGNFGYSANSIGGGLRWKF